MKNLRKTRSEGGITLIALVVTIIILLILAGITLSLVLSDGGLIDKSKEAIGEHKNAQEKEQSELGEAAGMMKNLIDGLGSTGGTTPVTPPTGDTGPTGKKLVTTVTEITDKNIQGEDSLGNPVVIPGGFKFAGQPTDTVEDGIIIEDDEGNQFVWIPVSNTDGDNNASTQPDATDLITLESGEKVEITLGRYTFRNAGYHIGSADLPDGTPELKQNGTNHSERSEGSTLIEQFYYEDTSEPNRPDGGAGAENLAGFVQSVQDNHGYYIARYEASFGSGTAPGNNYDGKTVETIMTNQKPYSKPSTNNSDEAMNYIPGMLWNFITQGDASKVSQNMYSGEDNEANYVESDLVNSYAWDTAIVYIQAMGNENYANANRGTNTSLKSTGETGDEKCHIFDMAGNVSEWTTEYSTDYYRGDNYPCVSRGGCCETDDYTALRFSYSAARNYGSLLGFRPLLYLK